MGANLLSLLDCDTLLNLTLDIDTSVASIDTESSVVDITFSNLMDSVETKIEEVQTEFVDRAVKTNISSINRFALDDDNNSSDTNLKTDDKNSILLNTNSELLIDIQKDDTNLKDTDKNDKYDTLVNNNSFIQPSPVFFENVENKENEKDVEQDYFPLLNIVDSKQNEKEENIQIPEDYFTKSIKDDTSFKITIFSSIYSPKIN